MSAWRMANAAERRKWGLILEAAGSVQFQERL